MTLEKLLLLHGFYTTIGTQASRALVWLVDEATLVYGFDLEPGQSNILLRISSFELGGRQQIFTPLWAESVWGFSLESPIELHPGEQIRLGLENHDRHRLAMIRGTLRIQGRISERDDSLFTRILK